MHSGISDLGGAGGGARGPRTIGDKYDVNKPKHKNKSKRLLFD